MHPHTLVACKICKEYKQVSEGYAPHAVAARLCRACLAQRKAKSRQRQSQAQAILSRLKRYCRTRGILEGKLWVLRDVEGLLSETELLPPIVTEAIRQGLQPKLRIVQVDKNGLFLPNNARLEV